MLLRTFLPLLVLIFLLLSSWGSIADPIVGVAPEDEWYFKPSVIKCKDGSGKFTRKQLNDEFCDCPDGTDEPGTSACPEGKFHCRNVGHIPISIFSSRVNDGICDCCDGSDEYDGRKNCSNTCWEAGKVARDRLKKRIAIFEEGVIIRGQEIKKARDAFSKDEAELAKLKEDEKVLKGLVQKLKEHKEQIEKAEEEERLKREKEEQIIKGLEQKDKEEKGSEVPENTEEARSEDVPDTSVTDRDHAEPLTQAEVEEVGGSTTRSEVGKDESYGDEGTIQDQESPTSGSEVEIASNNAKEIHEKNQDSARSEGLSKEELGRLVASRWTGEKVDDKSEKMDGDAGKHEAESETVDFPESSGEDYDGYNSETEDDSDKYDGNDFDDKTVDNEDNFEHEHGHDLDHDHGHEWGERDSSDISISGGQSWLGRIQKTVQNVLQAINLFKTPLNISDATRIRKEYDDASSKLSKIQSKISSLTEKLKADFGDAKQFYLFYNDCLETKQNKYTYKVCPFKQASQVEGHSTTRLGSWDKFEDSYRVMTFSSGDRCWNGPDRSLKVRLKCGIKVELTEVDEPSRCEYVAVLSTPLLCLDTKLKELREKLEQLNSGHFSHDEL